MPTPYLFFDGRAQEAIDFYQRALGAQVQMLMRFKDNPSPGQNPPGSADKVMHSCVTIGGGPVMISDGNCGGRPSFQGFSLSYDEYARSMFTTGPDATLPLAVMAQLDRQLTPEIYAVGTTTTLFSLIAVTLCTFAFWAMRRSTSVRRT
jgi:uncharacterized glyoxalase superfamily protein PhnB